MEQSTSVPRVVRRMFVLTVLHWQTIVRRLNGARHQRWKDLERFHLLRMARQVRVTAAAPMEFLC